MIVNDTGFAFGHAHCFRLREALLRVNERLTGHRLLRGAVVPGGVAGPAATAPLPDLARDVAALNAEFQELARLCLDNAMVLERLIGTGRLTPIFARRFVAGERPQDAVRAGERLHAKGIMATFDKLGEDVLDRQAAKRATDAAKELLRLIPPGIERNISIKMSSMGQEISRELCLENVGGILDVAKETGGFVRLDMEGSKLTQDTLDVFHALRARHDNVGIVLQAALHRTPNDVKEAVRRGDRVRLCKGAYREPPEVALQDMARIREAFKARAHERLDRGQYPAIATHDEELIQDTIAHARAKGIPAARFEFQMLYGLRKGRWEELVRDGWNVRVYVPFGTHWIPYFYRRLRERKENVLFVLRNLFR